MLRRIYAHSVFATGVMSYLVWMLINNLDVSIITSQELSQEMIRIVIGAIFSYGFFSLTTTLLVFCVDRFSIIKRLIFRSSYIEGAWVGFYIVVNTREVFLTIEDVRQTIEEITINGQLYKLEKDDNSGYYGTWESNMESFDKRKKELSYTYDSMYIDHSRHKGLVTYKFNCYRGRTPTTFVGYDFDDDHNKETVIRCKRHKKNKGTSYNIKDTTGVLLIEAKDYYLENKHFYSVISQSKEK